MVPGHDSRMLFVAVEGFDYYVFAQQWPPAACLNVPGGKCSISEVVSTWSIHGLWPTNHKGYPSFCNGSWPFKPQLLKDLIVQLEAKWPNIYAHSSEISFWKHEWQKHGTCAATETDMNTEHKYFKNSLQLHDQFDIYQFIKGAGIEPSKDQPYSLQTIQDAIYSNVNVTIKLFCKNHQEYEHPILTSMYICFDKQLGLIGCDEIKETTCKNTYVYYLPFPDRKPSKRFLYYLITFVIAVICAIVIFILMKMWQKRRRMKIGERMKILF
ncbi:ribonuclease Oy isoform X3 [Parasteatoda tepidariorum]|uniref:ribonuclease Oy isoform X3 n=1 Tax=Parasteatoda tepidariorum TaxID=114398 RepID=UPI001C71CCD0|nr:ribonuclease Oy isoform X3 [Parasteatoda tepidariorum]